MKKQNRQMLSLLVAICMLIAMLPVGMLSASAIEADVATYRYNLHSLQYDEWGSSGRSPSYITSYYQTMWGNSKNVAGLYATNPKQILGPYTTAMTDPFMPGPTSANAGWVWGDKAYCWITANGATSPWVSLKVLVPTYDTYEVETNFGVWASGPSDVKLFIAPVGAENPRDVQYQVGGANKSENLNGATNWNALQTWGSVELNAGEYIVSYVQTGAGRMGGGSLTLKGTMAPDILNIVPNYGTNSETSEPNTKAYVENGSTATIPLSMDFNGETYSSWADLLEEGSLVVESSDPAIATAEVTGNNLVVTGTGVGTTSINVRMIVLGVMSWIEIPVETTASQTYRVLTLGSKTDLSKLYNRKPATSELTAVIDTVAFNFTGATVNVTVEPANIATASVNIDAEGVATLTVNPTAIGSGTIHLDATVDGVNDTLDIPVTVSDFAYKYNFLRFQYGQWSSEGYAPSAADAWGKINTFGNFFQRTTDPFKYGHVSFADPVKTTWVWTPSAATYAPGIVKPSVGDTASYQVRLGQGGNYIPSFGIQRNDRNGARATCNVSYDVYIAPVGAADLTAAQYKVGSGDNLTDTPYVSGTFPVENLVLPSTPLAAGDYEVTFKFTEVGAGTEPSLYIRDITLTDNATPWINLGDSAVEVMKGQSVTIDSSIPAGATYDLVNLNTALISATVNEAGDIVVTGNDAGDAELYLSAKNSEAAGAQHYKVKVTLPYRVLTLASSANLASLYRGETVTSTITADIDDTVFNFTGATVGVTVEPSDLAAASIAVDENGAATLSVTPSALGSGTLHITATVDGVDGTLDIPFTSVVRPVKYRYNLHSLQNGQYGSSGYAPTAVTSYYKTMMGNSQNIAGLYATNPNQVKGPYEDAYTTPFMAGPINNTTWVWGDKGYTWIANAGDGAWVSLKVLVPNTDTYSFETNLGTWASGVENVSLYIAPVGAENPRDAQYQVGTVLSTKAATINWNALQTWGGATKELAAGEYIVSYVQTSATGRITGGSLTLTGTHEKNTLTVTPNYGEGTSAAVTAGKTTSIPLAVALNGVDNATWNESATDVVVDPVNSATATAVLDGKNLVVTGVAEGTTSVNVRMTVNGAMGWVEVPVTVAADAPAVTIGTINGAQIRTSTPTGLRFISSISKADIAAAGVTEYGTILIPTADITNPDEFVIGATLNSHAVAKVPAQYLYDETTDSYFFTAVITNIAAQNYTRAYSAKAYAICGDGTVVYSDIVSSRNVYQVATGALNDPNGNLSEAARAVLTGIVDAVEAPAIALTLTAPVEGATASTTIGGVPADAKYTAVAAWTSTGGDAFSGEFASGTTYTATITLTRTEGTFKAAQVVSLNNEAMTIALSENNTVLTITKSYDFKNEGYSDNY